MGGDRGLDYELEIDKPKLKNKTTTLNLMGKKLIAPAINEAPDSFQDAAGLFIWVSLTTSHCETALFCS